MPRGLLRRYRAVLQQVERHGPVGRHFGPGRDVIRSLLGFGHFAVMVDPESGALYCSARERLAAQHVPTRSAAAPDPQCIPARAAAAGQTPRPGRR